MRRLRPLLFLLLAVAVAVPARAQGTRIKDLPLTTTIPTNGRIALDDSTFPALRGVSISQLVTNLGALAVSSKLEATNGVAVGLTTATVPTNGNAVVNKTALDAAAALALAKASNLSDLASAATARTNLGLGTLATQSGTFSGTSSGVNTGDQTTITGNAGTATALQTARAINGVSFDGTAAITVTAAAGTLTGSTLASGVTGSSLVSGAGGTFGTAAYIAAATKLEATNGVAVSLTTATVPTTGNSVVNKTALDASSAGVAGNATIQTATIATLRSFSPTYTLANGQQFTVGGYYSNGDGGGGDFRYDSTDTTSADNGGTIIVAASGARLKRIVNGPVNIKAWGAIGDASTDNAAVFRKAVTNTPNLFVPAGTFNVSGEIAIPSTLVITGESSRTAAINASTTNFIFVYQSPLDGYDENSALRISDLYFNAKNAIKVGNGTNSFPSQRALLHGVIKDCYFNGALGLDPNQNTAVVPSESELLDQGVAIYGAKLFDFTFSNLHVSNYGIGFALYGCDINNITDTRAVSNSRHFHLVHYSTYGSQNKIQNCDLLQNLRVGAIYDENWFTSIKDNYFETYTDAAQFVIVRGGIGSLLWGNRMDCTTSLTPMLSLAPLYDYIVANNRYQPNTPASTIEVLPTYWTVNFQELVTFIGNSSMFPETRWPQCRFDKYSSDTLWDAWSPKTLGGVKATSYPWSTNSVTGLPAVQGGSDSLYVYFTPNMNWSTMAIKFSGVSIGGASGYAVVTWGTSNVFAGSLGLTTTNALKTVSFPITRPAGIAPNAQILVELLNSQTAIHSIELVGAGADSVGTVTSVSASVPAFLSVSGSPITTNGTIAIAYSGTALPVENGGTGLTALGTGVATAIGTAVTGTGGIAMSSGAALTSPTLTTPTLGVAGASKILATYFSSQYRAKNSIDGTGASLLASGGNLFIGANVYYNDVGAWTLDAPAGNTNSQLLMLSPGNGALWYASSSTNASAFNVANAVQLWNAAGIWSGSATSASTLTTGRTISITGDLTWTSPAFNGSANVTAAGTLATVNGNVGTFGSATQAPQITVNAKGLATAAANVTITPAVGSITGLGSGVATLLAGTSSGTGGPAGTTSPALITPSLGVATGTSLVATAGVTGATLTSTVATGTAPLTVASTTKVTNLNADTLDGLDSTAFQPANQYLTNLASAGTTGSGTFVRSTSPTLVTPTLGDASATSLAVASGITAGSIASFGAIGAGGAVTGSNLSGTNTGDQTTVSGNAGTATTLATGRTIAITGDLTWTSPSFNGSGNVTAAGTLASSGVAAGAYGSASYIPTITVDAKGRVTSVTTNAVSGGGGGGGGNVYTATTSTNGFLPMFSGATGTNLVQSFLFAETGVGLHIGSGTYGTGDDGNLYLGAAFGISWNLYNSLRTFSIQLAAPGGLSSDQTIGFPAASGTVALTSDLPTLGTGVANALAVANNAAGGYSPIDGTATLSNKRITSRVASPAYAATVTMDSDSYDVYNIGALTGNITLAAPTGTPTDGQGLLVRMLQDGTGGRTITFNAAFAFGSDVTSSMMPSGASAKWEFKAVWHSTDSKWRVVGLARGF